MPIQIIDTRGTGKTSRLMVAAKKDNGIFVSMNPYAMKEKAKNYGIIGLDVISYEDYFNKNYDTSKPCYIDELERYVAYIGNDFKGYSLTTGD